MSTAARSAPLRIAHVTDIHWFVPPKLRDLEPKRWLGSLNLYVMGRRYEFDERVQSELVSHLRQLRPDLVLITGDLTAQALPGEFAKAQQALQPLLDELPTLIIPGNHDVYTPSAVRERWFHKTFGAWGGTPSQSRAGVASPGLTGSGLVRLDVGPITALGLDPTRPLWVNASGRIPERQLAELADELASPELRGRTVVLAMHYPPIDRHGILYNNPTHGLLNADDLVRVLEAAPIRPCLLACGHVHHGFRKDLVLSDGGAVTVLNCGTSGHVFDAERDRTASAAVYHVADNRLVAVERYQHDGQRFVPERGGAFASGR